MLKRSKISQKSAFNKTKKNPLLRKNSNIYNQKLEDNIERIATILKQSLHDSLIKREKEKEKDKENSKDINNSKNENNNTKNLDFNINLFDFETINYILNKTKRSLDEILIIKSYLSTMTFLSTLKVPISNDKLLYSLSIYLKIEKKTKDTILFRFGNRGNKFYIILEGQVSIFILKETKAVISFKRYFLHILLLKMLKEEELIRKTILANSKKISHFDDKDFDIYYEKIVNFTNKYFKKNIKYEDIMKAEENKEENNYNNNSKNEFNINTNQDENVSNKNKKKVNIKFKEESIIHKEKPKNNNDIKNKNNSKDNLISTQITKEKKSILLKTKAEIIKTKDVVVSKQSLGSNEIYREEINYSNADLPYFEIHEIKEIILYYIYLRDAILAKNNIVTIDDYIKNTYLDSPFHRPISNEHFCKKDPLIIFQYFEVAKKKIGDSFGELALQREDSKRTGTVLITSDCTLGYLSRRDYNTYLGEIEVKRRKNDINFVMSFPIFDNMNRNVFENRYFNYFTQEYFNQGEKIILQDQKISKIFFIKEGQFEINTDLSINKLYSIIQYKTKKEIDEKNKIKLKNQNFNMRLYICYNKDILGLDDCIYKDGISFITAKCLSSNACAFTIEKTILNEIKNKIPEIDEKINMIKEKREQVMVDRLTNICNRIVLMNKKDKVKIKMNNNKKETNECINYLFGINQNQKNNELKTVSSRTVKNRIQSALPLKKRKIIFDVSNKDKDNMNNNNIEYNTSIKNNINNNESKYNYNSHRMIKHKFTQDIYIFNNDVDINNKIENIKKNKNNNIINKDNKLMSKSIDNIGNIGKEENNENCPLLNNKINEIMNSKEGAYKWEDNNLMLKISNKLNRVSNKHTQKKFKSLYNPLNKIISKEYSNLFGWLDDNNQQIQISSKNKKMVNNFTNTDNQCLKPNFSDKNSFYLSNRKNNYNNKRKRPLSCSNSQKSLFIFNYNNNNDSYMNNNNELLYQCNMANYNKKNKNNKYSKEIISRILNGDIINTQRILKELDYEKYLKKIVGVRYRDHFVSYEEEKLVKLIDSNNIKDRICNKRRKNKTNLFSYSLGNNNRQMKSKIIFNSYLIKK